MVRVMIVDDEVPIRQWLEFCINRLDGYQVSGMAGNGAEGFSLFRKTRPDIIITDIRMPVMDGLEMIKLVQNTDSSAVTIVLTSHEDFSYAREAVRLGAFEYILKTEINEESLKVLLAKASQQRMGLSKTEQEKSEDYISKRNHYLRSLVWNRNRIEVSESVVQEYGIMLKNGCFVAIDVMGEKENVSQIQWMKADFLTNIMKISLDLRHTILVGNFDKMSSPSMERQRELLRDYCIGMAGNGSCKIGCSDIGNNISHIGEIMKQAYERAILSFYYPKQNVFMDQKTGSYYIQNGEKYKVQFSKELLNQNWEQAEQVKNQIIQEIKQEQIVDIEYVKKMYLFMLTSLFHVTKEDIEYFQKQIEDMEDLVQKADTLADMEQIFQKYFQSCTEGSGRLSQYSSAVCRAVAYMEKYYMKPITLSDVALSVGLSAEYLSRLFKEETGIKFVVYLNNLRLKQALQLLENTNLKVYEVAEAVGYSNLSYFSTVFKKNFGQNPFDYKNKFNKG